jgi:hypothetical protein
MISNREIWGCALAILRQYREFASAHAGLRADELLAGGDVEGHHTWIRILERINQLESEPGERESLQ